VTIPIAGFIYTSGTTGKPKGVLLSHHNITSNLGSLLELFTFEPEDRSLAFLPWAHSYGQIELHALLARGSSTAINDDVARLLPNLAEVKPTVLVAVPRIFNRIYEAVNHDIARRPGFLQRISAPACVARSRGTRASGSPPRSGSISPSTSGWCSPRSASASAAA
jgi:long-chain acyl-CoA synthetase